MTGWDMLGQSKSLRKLAWGIVGAVPLTAIVWKAADIITALAHWVAKP